MKHKHLIASTEVEWRINTPENQTTTGLDNGLSPCRCQAITLTIASYLSFGLSGPRIGVVCEITEMYHKRSDYLNSLNIDYASFSDNKSTKLRAVIHLLSVWQPAFLGVQKFPKTGPHPFLDIAHTLLFVHWESFTIWLFLLNTSPGFWVAISNVRVVARKRDE